MSKIIMVDDDNEEVEVLELIVMVQRDYLMIVWMASFLILDFACSDTWKEFKYSRDPLLHSLCVETTCTLIVCQKKLRVRRMILQKLC